MLKKALILFSFSVIWYTSNAQIKDGSKIKVVNYDQLEPYLHKNNDTIYLVNFWATWCAPCIKELPAIKSVEQKYTNEKFKVMLVSLDFTKDLTSRLEPFVKSKNITSDVFLLNDPDQNRWIDKVDPKWSGEIPFMLIYGKHFRESYSRTFNYEELDSIINLKLNLP
jgi:thiol-disulfide isomerase/thioredoxin